MKLYETCCGDETHRISIDDNGVFHLLDHDLEEEETLKELGGDTPWCLTLVNALSTCPDGCLFAAAESGDLALAKIAIDSGAKIAHESRNALLSAVTKNNVNIVKYFLSEACDVNYGNYHPLSAAVYYGYIEIVELLLNAGAKIADTNTSDWIMAIEFTTEPIRRLLQKHDYNTDVHTPSDDTDENAK